jgi:isopentenyldiphosphate isomerase
MSHSTNVQQNDPSEFLEIFDRAGQPTGTAKPRAAIHLDGDWHRAFHCWILRRNGQEVVLQRRSLRKDTFAGCWDATAAGHWRFGETAAQAAREIGEELGINVPFQALTYLGRERSQRSFANGLIDREFHEVYVLSDDRPLSAYRPHPAEVIGLAALRLSELIALVADRTQSVQAVEAVSVRRDGKLDPISLSIGRHDVVPYSAARLRRNLGPQSRVTRI